MRRKYPYEPSEIAINGKNIRIVGVTHTSEFFSRYAKTLKNFVGESEAIAIEKNRLVFPLDCGADFFNAVTQIGVKEQVPVYTVDSSSNLLLELGIELVQNAAGIFMTKEIVRHQKNEKKKPSLTPKEKKAKKAEKKQSKANKIN